MMSNQQILWDSLNDQAVQEKRDHKRQQQRFALALEDKMNQSTLKFDNMITKGRQCFKIWQQAGHRRRLRRAILRAAARLHEQYPQWEEILFDAHFLLGRGMPIIERHVDHAAPTDAFDLALVWAEQWPHMSTARRKSHLQVLAPIAADFLYLLTQELMVNRRTTTKAGSDTRHRSIQGAARTLQSER